MSGNGSSDVVSAVDVDRPELLDLGVGIGDGGEVLADSGRGDEVVDCSVALDDGGYSLVDGGRGGDVGRVGCD
jgi:hypothetical protein